MKEGECKGRASWKYYLSWVSEDQVGPDRQVRDGDFFSGSEKANFTNAQGGPSRSTCSECVRCIYS